MNQRLTPRERQITALVSAGLSNKQIASRLELAVGTVKIHLHHIYQKTGVANRTALAVLTVEPHKETSVSASAHMTTFFSS